MMVLLFAVFLVWWFYCLGIILRKKFYCDCDTTLNGKTILITGASDGLGAETAYALASRGAKIIMTCRDYVKGEKVLKDIARKTRNQNLSLKYLDFADLQTVKDFADEIMCTEDKIDVLINNAGIGNGVGLTKDNYPLLFGTNVLGPFLLNNLLLKILRKSNARIVFVSSIGHRWGSINFDELLNEDGGSCQAQFKAYTASKLAGVLLSKELHFREFDNGITTFALHPGTAFTSIFRTFPTLLKVITYPILALILKSAEEGAQTQIHCAIAPGLERYSGKYFADCRLQTANTDSNNAELRQELWRFCTDKVKPFLPSEQKDHNTEYQQYFKSYTNCHFTSCILNERCR